MKRPRLLISPLVTLALVLLAAALFTDLFGGQLIPGLPKLSLQRVERFQSSTITLSEVRSVASLTSVQLIHRAVFPYDYLPRDVSITGILRKLRESNASIADTLTPEEQQYFRTFSLAREIDLGMTGETFDFVVVSLILTAGYRLEEGDITIEVEEFSGTDGVLRRRALVHIGEPAILSTAVEDVVTENYPYPDASLSAEGWRRVAEFVVRESVPGGRTEALLSEARERTEQVLRTMLLQAGIHEVEF